jgi:hypothetical protein
VTPVQVSMLIGQGSQAHVLVGGRCAHQVHERLMAWICRVPTAATVYRPLDHLDA